MRFLVRDEAPKCLGLYKYGKDKWSVISQDKKTDEVWQSINKMQQGFCAYCERKLKNNSRSKHLEHFFSRRNNPKLTFSWPNIFGSCSSPNSCGVFKDSNPAAKKVDLNSVCKPDIDNPENYLVFLNDGKVKPKHGLGALDNKKALNTIQVFNLDDQSKLVNSRRQAIANEKQLADKFWEAMSDNDGSEELQQILESERLEALTRIENQAHRTALKCLWEFNAAH